MKRSARHLNWRAPLFLLVRMALLFDYRTAGIAVYTDNLAGIVEVRTVAPSDTTVLADTQIPRHKNTTPNSRSREKCQVYLNTFS